MEWNCVTTTDSTVTYKMRDETFDHNFVMKLPSNITISVIYSYASTITEGTQWRRHVKDAYAYWTSRN